MASAPSSFFRVPAYNAALSPLSSPSQQNAVANARSSCIDANMLAFSICSIKSKHAPAKFGFIPQIISAAASNAGWLRTRASSFGLLRSNSWFATVSATKDDSVQWNLSRRHRHRFVCPIRSNRKWAVCVCTVHVTKRVVRQHPIDR